MKTAHTPTPWYFYEADGWDNDSDRPAKSFTICTDNLMIAKCSGLLHPDKAKEVLDQERANAQFIVRAVNNHDALMRLAEMVAAGNTEFDALEREARAALAAARKEGAK